MRARAAASVSSGPRRDGQRRRILRRTEPSIFAIDDEVEQAAHFADATSGTPQARASIAESPSASKCDGCTTRSEALMIGATSASGPTKRNAGAKAVLLDEGAAGAAGIPGVAGHVGSSDDEERVGWL